MHFVLIGILAQMFLPAAPMTTARAGHSATLLRDGTVLIAGGDGDARLGTIPSGRTAELYDPATGTFARTGSMIKPRYMQTATLLPNGKVLIAGGSRDTTAEVYDPATREFSLTGPMISQQNWQMAVLLASGKVLIAGDVDAELYDPATESFSLAGPYAGPSRGEAATLLLDGRVLITGDNPAQIYDPVTDSFSVTGSLSVSGLELLTATLLTDGKVLVAGGMADEIAPAGRCSCAELYDPLTGEFTATSSMHAPRDAHAAVLLPNGEVLVIGGDTASGNSYAGSLASTELYDPKSGTFAAAGDMRVARSLPQATLLANGDVLITGGFTYCGIGCFKGSVVSAEIYHPVPPRSRRRVAR